MAIMNFKDELLSQIATALNKYGDNKICHLEVEFVTDDDERYTFALPEALNALANDTYWDERGNWSKARIAIVRTL